MSTSPIWTVHCDSGRVADLETRQNGMSVPVDPCHFWVGQEDSLGSAQRRARSEGWTVLTRFEAYCPPCAIARTPPT